MFAPAAGNQRGNGREVRHRFSSASPDLALLPSPDLICQHAPVRLVQPAYGRDLWADTEILRSALLRPASADRVKKVSEEPTSPEHDGAPVVLRPWLDAAGAHGASRRRYRCSAWPVAGHRFELVRSAPSLQPTPSFASPLIGNLTGRRIETGVVFAWRRLSCAVVLIRGIGPGSLACAPPSEPTLFSRSGCTDDNPVEQQRRDRLA